MTDDPNMPPQAPSQQEPSQQEPSPQEPDNAPPSKPSGPVMMIPKSYYYLTAAIVVGSIILTLFVKNPYTRAVETDFNEGSNTDGLLWVAIFIGIPASFFAYKKWILPLFERR